MTNTSATVPTPATGRPLTTVNQVYYALKNGPVFCELTDGRIEQVYQAQRKQGVFQVKLENNQWEASPRRVWAVKAVTGAAPAHTQTPPADTVHITRTPVGDRSLDDLQALVFQEPLWLEATSDNRWVIILQWGHRHLAFKNCAQEKPVFTAPTLTELVALLREQEWTNHLLDQDEHAPLRSWQIATPVVSDDGSSS
jgi:hypothetical protein